MPKLYGLIPAAGKGTRAGSYTANLPKSMLEINGVPNLQRNIELMRDQLGIEDIIIIVGYLGKVIKGRFQDGRQLDVRLHYIENNELDRGLAWSILLGRQFIDDYFCVILSDECYIGSNHHQLLDFPYRSFFATCFVKEVDNLEIIKKNYAVKLRDDRIQQLVEKPLHPENNILGCGTFVFSPEIFPVLEQAFAQSTNDYVEFITFLNETCRHGKAIAPFQLTGNYVNINDRDSLYRANYHERSMHFAGYSKALLIYSEGTEKNVGFTINRYRKVSALDSFYLLVPFENTIAEEAQKLGVNIIRCPPGIDRYGEKIKYALQQIDSDIIILTEADYAFPARDVHKLLSYLQEADMVVGTRTTRQLMEHGVDLSATVRMANIFIAKLMELLWWHFEGRFSDVGCTFRAFWRTSYLKIADSLEAPGPEFSAEMMLLFLRERMRIFEIPVNYRNVSRALNKRYRNLTTFMRFLKLLAVKRLFR